MLSSISCAADEFNRLIPSVAQAGSLTAELFCSRSSSLRSMTFSSVCLPFECSAHGLVPLTVILIPCTHPAYVLLFQAGCEVPLDPAIPAASIEHQHVVVETAEQFAGTDARKARKFV